MSYKMTNGSRAQVL